MKEEINLEEIIDKNSRFEYDEDGDRIFYLWQVKNMLKQACLKTLELAADNATVDIIDWEDNTERIKNLPALPIYGVDPKSILNLKDKIK